MKLRKKCINILQSHLNNHPTNILMDRKYIKALDEKSDEF